MRLSSVVEVEFDSATFGIHSSTRMIPFEPEDLAGSVDLERGQRWRRGEFGVVVVATRLRVVPHLDVALRFVEQRHGTAKKDRQEEEEYDFCSPSLAFLQLRNLPRTSSLASGSHEHVDGQRSSASILY